MNTGKELLNKLVEITLLDDTKIIGTVDSYASNHLIVDESKFFGDMVVVQRHRIKKIVEL